MAHAVFTTSRRRRRYYSRWRALGRSFHTGAHAHDRLGTRPTHSWSSHASENINETKVGPLGCVCTFCVKYAMMLVAINFGTFSCVSLCGHVSPLLRIECPKSENFEINVAALLVRPSPIPHDPRPASGKASARPPSSSGGRRTLDCVLCAPAGTLGHLYSMYECITPPRQGARMEILPP